MKDINFTIFMTGVILMLILIMCISLQCAKAEEINLDIIALIESSGNPLAYNTKSGACGVYQITEICFKEYNNYHRNSPILHKTALFNPEINRRIAEWYLTIRIPQMLRYYKKPVTLTTCLIAYSAGIRAVVKGYIPKETQNYILK